MLCTVGHHDRPSWPFVSLYLIFLSLILVLSLLSIFHPVHAAPIPELVQEYENMLPENSSDNLTEIAANTDVYVIKAVVYEIGILKDSDNTTALDESTDRQERVDISLYDPPLQEDKFL